MQCFRLQPSDASRLCRSVISLRVASLGGIRQKYRRTYALSIACRQLATHAQRRRKGLSIPRCGRMPCPRYYPDHRIDGSKSTIPIACPGFSNRVHRQDNVPFSKISEGIANDHADLSAATIECPSGIILVGKTDEVLSVLRGGVTGHARITSINADAPPATLNVARSPGSSATVSWDSSATGSRSASRMEIAFCAGDVLKCTNTSH